MSHLEIAEETTVITDLHETAPTKFINVNGLQFAYRIFGNKGGLPLVFLHHFTATIDDWDPLVTNGLAQYFQVVLFDNKGIGASEGKTPDNIQAMTDDARAFIKALGFDKVNLLGLSMGGFIAQQIALDTPELVNKIILAGTCQKGGEGIANIPTVLKEAYVITPEEPRLYLFYSASSTSRALGRQSLGRIKKRITDRVPDTSIASIEAQLKSILGWAQADENALQELKKIKHPVLVVNGNNDIMVPTINSYTLFQHLPNAWLSLYPDSGHGAIFQYPQLFVTEVIQFLEDK